MCRTKVERPISGSNPRKEGGGEGGEGVSTGRVTGSVLLSRLFISQIHGAVVTVVSS